MRLKIFYLLIVCFLAGETPAQQADKKTIRIVDTLSVQDNNNRNPVILKSELDSLIRAYTATLPSEIKKQEAVQPDRQAETATGFILPAILLILALLVFLVYGNRRRSIQTMTILKKQFEAEQQGTGPNQKSKKTKPGSLEEKIDNLHAEVNKLTKENEGLNRVINEYNGIQHEFTALKHGMTRNYKVKNYPGYDKQKPESNSFQKVLETENAIAQYAYEKFLKPILVLADNNKNNPAKISPEDMNRILDLLISLSLLYIEYLYLRVSELSIGGKMVERMQGLSNGNGIDRLLLRKLDVQHGSRALVVKMVLNKLNLGHLSYPVFDETDLNQ